METREQGAIGIFEKRHILINAETPEAATAKAVQRFNASGFETRFPISVNPVFNHTHT